MATTATTRLGLIKPTPGTGEPVNVQTQLNDSWDKIDAAVGATVCTSSTRPTSPYSGQIIFETDTNKMYVRTAAGAWLQIATSGTSIGSLNVGGFAVSGSERCSKTVLTTGNVNSTSYANIPGSSALSFTKTRTDTTLRVDMKLTCYTDANNTGVQLGVNINGVDYDVAKHMFTVNTQYESFNGFAHVTNLLTAGTWSIQPRWKRFTGSGIIHVASTFSELDLSVREVADTD